MITLAEGIEGAFKFGGGHADSGVLHRHDEFVAVLSGRNEDFAAGGGKFGGRP